MNTFSDAARRGGGADGEYRLLHEYLKNRFADRVVLTFSQIEDILGSSLPGVAWVERSWWEHSEPGSQRTRQSDAWTQAGRSASVNLLAQCVLFEREVTV
jgi:hypothetical protein